MDAGMVAARASEPRERLVGFVEEVVAGLALRRQRENALLYVRGLIEQGGRDLGEAVDSPRLLSDDLGCAQRVLDLIASVLTPVWGRDELGAGEMWNSNSMMSWVITRAGMEVESIQPPVGGRTRLAGRDHRRPA